MKKDKVDKKTEQPYTGRTYAYIAVALIFGAALFFGLAFTVMGIYSLIASLILSLGSLAFLNVQKKKNDFGRLVILKICAYVVLFTVTAFFIGGIIWSAK